MSLLRLGRPPTLHAVKEFLQSAYCPTDTVGCTNAATVDRGGVAPLAVGVKKELT
jgi:hypothetical protein